MSNNKNKHRDRDDKRNVMREGIKEGDFFTAKYGVWVDEDSPTGFSQYCKCNPDDGICIFPCQGKDK